MFHHTSAAPTSAHGSTAVVSRALQDTDGSGFIEPNEFIRPLSRWVHDSKTAPSTLATDGQLVGSFADAQADAQADHYFCLTHPSLNIHQLSLVNIHQSSTAYGAYQNLLNNGASFLGL